MRPRFPQALLCASGDSDLPASYAYLLCIGLLCIGGGIVRLHGADIWHAVTYTVNYYPFRSWEIGHLWSLSVEEQFYLLWPFAFVSLGPRRAVWVVVAVIILGPFARAASRLFLLGTPYHDLEMFPMVADSLAAGCLLAHIRSWLEAQPLYLRLFHPIYSIMALALVLLINRLSGYTVVSVVGNAVSNLAIAFLIHRSVYQPGDLAGRFLNWRPFAFIGMLSYSLYLWQQLFLNRASSAWVNAFPQNIFLACAAASISYLALEKPLMKLRSRFRRLISRC